MEERHLIATYCRFNKDNANVSADDYSTVLPKHVLNRIKKAKDTFSRLAESHADDEFMKVLLFGSKTVNGLKKYAVSLGLPEESIETDSDCENIAQMVKKVWKRMRANVETPRIYFVLSNWQWVFIEPLLSLKDEQIKFYFEGAIDDRTTDEIEFDKRLEKVARIELKESKLGNMLDKVSGSVSENMKG